MTDTVKTEVLPEVKPVSEKPRVERTGVVRKSKTAHAGRFSYKYASLAPVRAGAGGNNPMQAYGAALTYARRYSLQMA